EKPTGCQPQDSYSAKPSHGLLSQASRRIPVPSTSLRSLATIAPSSTFPQTRISTLPNGLTVATEPHPHSQTATVGIWIDSGSRADKHGGTAHFLEHLAFKGTQKRTQHSLELEIENLGAHLNAYTSREQTSEIISDILQNSKLEEGAIERERSVILREQEEVDKAHEEVVFDHLHAVAFQGEDLVEYIKSNYTADRMLPRTWVTWPTSSTPIPLGGRGQIKPTGFTGSEVRIRDDTMDTINLAIAVEGVGWNSPDLFPMLVMQSIFGNWDRSLGSSPLMSSRLSHQLSSNNLVNSFLSFSTSYSDTGLWGIYMVSENLTNVDDLVYITLREWQRMSTAPTEIEVARAKSQLKASMLFSLDSSNNIAMILADN
ncbi:hypothetical protein H4Q26_016557, partial [Puccinia striiformis f. sp. tritici PST-130]